MPEIMDEEDEKERLKGDKKTLKEMNPKNVYGVNMVLIKRGNKSFVPGGNDSLLPDDIVYVVGTTQEIYAFREAVNGNKQKKK